MSITRKKIIIIYKNVYKYVYMTQILIVKIWEIPKSFSKYNFLINIEHIRSVKMVKNKMKCK